jgi:exopolysaccharide biosynthesis polyprenyl glycosylphosphotransferase
MGGAVDTEIVRPSSGEQAPAGTDARPTDPLTSTRAAQPGRGVDSHARATPPAFRRKARARAFNLLLPALAAGLAADLVTGRLGSALIFALATLITTRLLRRFHYPLALLPVSRAALAGAGPVLAVVGVSAAGALAFDAALPAHEVGTIAAFALIVAVGTDVLTARWMARVPMRVAILGSPEFAIGLRRELRENPVPGIELIGWLDAGGELVDDGPVGRAAINRLRNTIIKRRIDLVVRGRSVNGGSGAGFGGTRPFEFAAEACVDLPVRMMDGAQFYEESFGHVPLGMIDSAWYLFLMHPRYRSTGARAKRALDLVVGPLATLVALPLIAIAAVAIKLEDRGPVLYRQRRVGEAGREFEIVKLRTMSVDAEADGAQWSTASDSRITRVGGLLRRTHIDELPQLYNVLSGDMTLVGPRPERPELVSTLEQVFSHYRRRHLVKPGVTGWAQVRCGYAGSEFGTAWKLCHDLFYLKHRSVLSDLLIMLETVAIAAKDAHRPMRVPSEEFVFGRESGHERGSNEPASPAPDSAPATASAQGADESIAGLTV